MSFTYEQCELVAKWWAQFLPGRKNNNWNSVNQFTKFGNDYLGSLLKNRFYLFQPDKQETVSDEQYNRFIKILAYKIQQFANEHLAQVNNFRKIKHVMISNPTEYEPPEILKKALEEAEIYISAMGTFPSQACVLLYHNGQVQIGKKILSTNPDIVHYDKHYDFKPAPSAMLNGSAFRIVKINIAELHNRSYLHTLGSLSEGHIEHYEKSSNYFYARIEVDEFKKTMQDFMQLTDSDLIKILQNKEEAKKYFKKSCLIHYDTDLSRLLKPHVLGVHNAHLKEITSNYYQNIAGPVKILSAPKEGSIDSYKLEHVKENDFLIYNEKQKSIHKCPRYFSAQLCDTDGNLLSDKIYKPGEVIPLKDTLSQMMDSVFSRLRYFSG